MKNTFQKVYEIVRQIPPGRVATYGDIAFLLGNPRLSRVVGYAMRACRDPSVPCHRVLLRDGTPSPAFLEDGLNRQRLLLMGEGVPFSDDGRVILSLCRWP